MGANERMRDKPDMEALVGYARELAKAASVDVSDADLLLMLENVLYGKKDAWQASRGGLITRPEAASLVLAHLESWLMERAGRTWERPLVYERDGIERDVEQALFGMRRTT